MDTSEKLLLTVPAAAKKIGLSVPTVRRLIRQGSISTVVVGKRDLVPVSAIGRWIDTGLKGEKDNEGKTDFNY